MSSEQKQDIEKMASAIEDLLYMKAIVFENIPNGSEKATLSTQFSLIVSNIMSDMNPRENDNNEIMKLMYYSLLIYINEYLKLPKLLICNHIHLIVVKHNNHEVGGLNDHIVTKS